ncbi:MAG: argininosuccinate synthase [Thermoleophilales bacterium]|nr:argininosuccinate synthase [Thermoleophilales bacterium]
MTIHQNNFKHSIDRHWAYMVYARPSGTNRCPARSRCLGGFGQTNLLTGEVTLKLFKGHRSPRSPAGPEYALYDENLASPRGVRGRVSQNAAPGFIELISLQSRMAHQVRCREKG